MKQLLIQTIEVILITIAFTLFIILTTNLHAITMWIRSQMDNIYMNNNNTNAELKLAYETIAKLHQIALNEFDTNNIDKLEYIDFEINNFYNEIDKRITS